MKNAYANFHANLKLVPVYTVNAVRRPVKGHYLCFRTSFLTHDTHAVRR